MKVLESLNQALKDAVRDDPLVVVLGEDLLDPYGGAFKATKGLSDAHPDQVLTTPVSEAGIVGIAGGMALRGVRPVVEIMFGDFTTLITDQIVNHAAKFGAMYNRQVEVPLVIRTPMGGRRGYGPTHSQTLDKMWLGIPDLTVLAVNAIGDPGGLLRAAIVDPGPVLFIENKLLYNVECRQGHHAELEVHTDGRPWPVHVLRVRDGSAPSITLAAYGHMAELAIEAMVRAAYEFEIFAELVVPTKLSPFDCATIVESVERTSVLMTLEEGTGTMGWGAEVVALVTESTTKRVEARRIAAPDDVIPSAPALEQAFLPGVDAILDSMRALG